MTRMSVYDHHGSFIGDIRSNPVYEWVLNCNPRPGRCEFSIARFDVKNTLKYLEFGRYILIRDDKLPDWIGEIVKRTWNSGNVDVLAMQCEYVLEKRNTPIQKYTGVAGSLFTQILQYTNSQPFNTKPIIPTLVYYGGSSREETLGDSALSHITSLAERSGNDFDVSYAFDDNGKLYLTGNWYERRGVITNKYLRQGHNIAANNGTLTEDAREMGNWVEGRGDASTTGTRILSSRYDEESISRYGLNQITEVFSGNKNQATLDDNTMNMLKNSLDPFNSFDVTALDVGSTFDNLDVGNVFELDMNVDGFNEDGSHGTQATVRVLGMEYDSMDKTCRLILERYISNDA